MQERHPTLGTAFTSAQMHFVNSLEQLSGGNSFKTTMCKNCESQKGQTHLTSSLSAYFSGLPEQSIEFLIFQLNDTRFSCEKKHEKKKSHFIYICQWYLVQAQNSFLLPAGEGKFSTAY